MLHIVKVSLLVSALLALWASLLKADLPSDQYQLVLYVSDERAASHTRSPARVPPPPLCRRTHPLTLPPQSPLLAVLAFGLYSALALLYGVLTFRTVPEEAESLKKVGRQRGTRPAAAGSRLRRCRMGMPALPTLTLNPNTMYPPLLPPSRRT